MGRCRVVNRSRVCVWIQCLILTRVHGHTPSGDGACEASGGAASGQSHRLHVLVDGGRLAQLDQHDVIVDQPGLVVGVRDHVLGRNDLLVAVQPPAVVLAEDDVHFAEREGEVVTEGDVLESSAF